MWSDREETWYSERSYSNHEDYAKFPNMWNYLQIGCVGSAEYLQSVESHFDTYPWRECPVIRRLLDVFYKFFVWQLMSSLSKTFRSSSLFVVEIWTALISLLCTLESSARALEIRCSNRVLMLRPGIFPMGAPIFINAFLRLLTTAFGRDGNGALLNTESPSEKPFEHLRILHQRINELLFYRNQIAPVNSEKADRPMSNQIFSIEGRKGPLGFLCIFLQLLKVVFRSLYFRCVRNLILFITFSPIHLIKKLLNGACQKLKCHRLLLHDGVDIPHYVLWSFIQCRFVLDRSPVLLVLQMF